MAIKMERKLQSGMKKLMNKQIDNNAWMKKLIDFYNEEMGSDSEMDQDDNDASSVGSLSSADVPAPVTAKPAEKPMKVVKEAKVELPSDDEELAAVSSQSDQ